MLKGINDSVIKLPFYAKISLILIGVFVFIEMLCLSKAIIVPLLFSIILSILLSTSVDFLVEKKVNRILAIILTILTAILIGVLMVVWITSKANLLIESLPILNQKFDQLQIRFVSWATEHSGFSPKKINFWINQARSGLTDLSGKEVGNTLVAMGNAIVILVLVPVYIFLFLYYQPILIEFIHRAVGHEHSEDVGIVLGQTRSVLKGYFAGLLIELVIVAGLNAIGFLALGLQFAILLAIVGAILNMVPYIGGAIMLVVSMLFALLTNADPMFAIYVALVFMFIQLIDNNYLMPKIVASKVKINALVAIVAVIAGGAIWGVPGMFLAIPLTAIIKVVFDRIAELQPWGFLLGDTMPPMVRIKLPRKKKKAED
jgi:predicted PurR-regulated permease PerM